MQTKLNPYLGLKDNARGAMESYKTVFGGNLVMNTFEEFYASQDRSEDDLTIHEQLDADNGMTLMGSDTPVRHGLEYKPGRFGMIAATGSSFLCGV